MRLSILVFKCTRNERDPTKELKQRYEIYLRLKDKLRICIHDIGKVGLKGLQRYSTQLNLWLGWK